MNLLQMSLSGALMILAVIVIRALGINKLPKRTFLALWGVVLLRLIIPYRLPSVLSVYSLADNLPSATQAPADLPHGAPVQIAAPAAPAPAAVETASAIPWGTILWLGGALTCLVFFAVAYFKCCREFRTSLPVDNDYVRLWLAKRRLRRRLEIRQSDKIAVPLTYGVFRPVILMPKTADWSDGETLKYVLAHEYVHIRRFDALVKLTLAATVCVHWFNPLVWVMYILANRDIELSCDEAVVRAFGERTKAAYARALISMRAPKDPPTPLFSSFNKNAIEERIVAIMKIKKTTALSIILAAAVVVGTTAAFATSAKEDTPLTPLKEDMSLAAPAVTDDAVVPPETEGTDNKTAPDGEPAELTESAQVKTTAVSAVPGSNITELPSTDKQPEAAKPSETVKPDDYTGMSADGKTLFYSRYVKDSSFLTAEDRDSYDKWMAELKEQYLNDKSSYMNSSGQIVNVPGLSMVTDREPDLVGYVGDNGVSGYCKPEEVNPRVHNPREAAEYMAHFNENRVKTLYDFEGNPIGTMTLPELSEREVAAAQKALDEMIANHMYED